MNELPSILCAVKECNGNSIKMHFGEHFATFFNTLFCHCFYDANNLQFLISLDMFYSLEFPFFFQDDIFHVSFCFYKHVEIDYT